MFCVSQKSLIDLAMSASWLTSGGLTKECSKWAREASVGVEHLVLLIFYTSGHLTAQNLVLLVKKLVLLGGFLAKEFLDSRDE